MDVTLTLREVPSHIAADAVTDLMPLVENMARNGLEVTLEVFEPKKDAE
jgi:hypothetical protein